MMKTLIRILSLTAAAAALATASPARAALIARYNFDDGTATDQSTNGNDGTSISNVTFSGDTPFASGQAGLSGLGASVIRVPTSTSLESIQDELTLSFWMKADLADQPDDWERIFRHADENTTHEGWIVNRNGRGNDIVIRKDAGNQNKGSGVGTGVYSDTWRHVMFTLDNGTWAEYVDGMLAGTGTYSHGTGFANTQPFLMFGRGSWDDYVGLLDDVAVWSDAKGPAWPASIAAMADWYGTSLDDPGLMDVADLDTLGATASAAGVDWVYTSSFAAPGDGSPLGAGKHYVGTDSVHYIVFEGDGQGGWLGVARVPEPSTLWLLGSGMAVLWLGRWRRRRPLC